MTLRTLKLTTLAALAVGSSATSSHAALTWAVGDVFLGIREGDNATSDFLINIGSANVFRDAVAPVNITLSNFATAATSAFGSDWATDSDLFWGFIGANSNAGTNAGNPGRTLFISEPTGFTPGASSSQSGQTSKYLDLKNDWLLQTESAAPNGSIGAPADENSWTSLVAAGFNNTGNLAPIEDTFATALDFFRVPQTTTAQPVTNEGSFSFSTDTGVLTFTPFGFAPIPEPSTAIFGALALGTIVIRRRRTVAA